jgi:excisionase family DNA binding protein
MPASKQMTQPSRLVYTISEAAEALALGMRTVQRLIARGELPVIRTGRSVRVRVEDLERWVEEKVSGNAA